MELRRTAWVVFVAIISPWAATQRPQIIWQRPAHPGGVNSVAFSPDGATIATAGVDKKFKLWSTVQGGDMGTFALDYDEARCVAFSPNGRYVAGGGIGRIITIVDRNTGMTVETGGGGFVQGLSFSPDSKWLAAGLGYSTNELDTFRVSDGQMLSISKPHWGTVWSCAYSPDGQYIASGGADSITSVLNSVGSQILRLGGHEGDIHSVTFSPNQALLASVGDDPRVQVWSFPSGSVYRSLVAPTTWLISMAFSPDGKLVIAAGRKYNVYGTITIWNLETGAILRNYTQETGIEVRSIAFSPNGKFFAYGTDDGKLTLARTPSAATP